MHPSRLPIARDGLQRWASHRANPLPRPLASHSRRLPDGVHIGNIQAHQLRESHSGGVKKFDDRGIARRHPCGGLFVFFSFQRRLDQRFHLRVGEKARQALLALRQQNLVQNILQNLPAHLQECIERPHRREAKPHTRPRHLRFHHLEHPGAKIIRSHRRPRPIGMEFPERLQCGAIGFHRQRGGIFLSLQIAKKLLRRSIQWNPLRLSCFFLPPLQMVAACKRIAVR